MMVGDCWGRGVYLCGGGKEAEERLEEEQGGDWG